VDAPVTTLPTPDVVTVYGAAWCNDCQRATRYLDATGVEYRYVDLQQDPSAATLLADAGYRAIPVIVLPSGEVLIEPSNAELAAAIR
jgi:mycoredoxin